MIDEIVRCWNPSHESESVRLALNENDEPTLFIVTENASGEIVATRELRADDVRAASRDLGAGLGEFLDVLIWKSARPDGNGDDG